MNPDPRRADEPNFNGEEYLETMEIDATLREWRRKNMAPREIPRKAHIEPLPRITELPSAPSPRQPKRRFWLFWKGRRD